MVKPNNSLDNKCECGESPVNSQLFLLPMGFRSFFSAVFVCHLLIARAALSSEKFFENHIP